MSAQTKPLKKPYRNPYRGPWLAFSLGMLSVTLVCTIVGMIFIINGRSLGDLVITIGGLFAMIEGLVRHKREAKMPKLTPVPEESPQD